MHDKQITVPNHTAVRVALWRALHVQIDSPPYVLEDEIGLGLAAPEDEWRQVATLAPGSTLAMTFLIPFHFTETEKRPEVDEAEKGARASGTPFISFYTPLEMLALAREAGFREVQHVSSAELNQRYFTGRADGLSLPSGEEFLVATT
ncbi:hypothetical protein [Brevibacillus porteri]|uniref:hypothetical protein n=1 Tax=Brevibacillus porteri TaxID=2126350 RepID=UPI003D2162B9